MLKEMPEEGKCGTECKTVQKAAANILESADTDMAEKLWQVRMHLRIVTMSSIVRTAELMLGPSISQGM